MALPQGTSGDGAGVRGPSMILFLLSIGKRISTELGKGRVERPSGALRQSYESLDELRIVPAQEKDVDTVLGILNEAAGWLASRGLSGWWRPGSFSREAFLGQIADGEVYLAKLGRETVGTITLQWKDQIFWKEASQDTGYVHKLAIRRAYTGKQIGSKMLEWAARQASVAGKRFLRLDCMAENQRIRLYYEAAGFIHRGDIQHSKWKASLYEKRL